MKIHKQAKTRNTLIAVIAAVVVLFGGAVAYAYATKNFPFNGDSSTNSIESDSKENDVNLDAPSDKQKDAGLDAKKDFVDKKYNEENNTPPAAASVAITSINGDENETNIRAMVNTTSANGACKVTAVNSDSTVEASAGLQLQGAYSVCKGFNLVLSKGKWSITVEYKDESGGTSKDVREYEVR